MEEDLAAAAASAALRNTGGGYEAAASPATPHTAAAPPRPGEKEAKLAQQLGQLQPFIAAFPQECMGQLACFGPT